MHPSKPPLSAGERLIRDATKLHCFSFGTQAPFQLGPVEIEKIGFGDIPVVHVRVFCKREQVSSLVPVARQYIYRELETAGMSSDILEFTPRVQVNQVRMFTDCNESSPTKGKTKRGHSCRFSFDIKPEHVHDFEWGGFAGKTGTIPTKKVSNG